MNDFLFALIIAAYITSGIFIVLWMEENYFDAKYGRESSKNGAFGVFSSGLSSCLSRVPKSERPRSRKLKKRVNGGLRRREREGLSLSRFPTRSPRLKNMPIRIMIT